MKDGREAVIRPARVRDATDLFEVDRLAVLDGRGVVRLPGDVTESAADLEPEVQTWIDAEQRGMRAKRVAEVDGRVVGAATIERRTPSLLRHAAILAVQVHPQYQGLGLGRALVQAVLDWAIRRSRVADEPLLRLELYVRADNARAVALYRSLGFAIESTRKRFLRKQDGSFVDDHCMVRFLDEE